MKIVLVHLLMLLPVYGEGLFDWAVWKYKWFGGKDKPFSTYVLRPALFGLAFWGVWYIDDVVWWVIIPVMLTYFGLFFPLLINWIRDEHWCYTSKGNPYDRLVGKIHCMPRLWMFVWFAIVAVCIYYYWG